MNTIDLPKGPLPRHVAIIMDGNGRWAKKHKLLVALGHRTGVEALRSVIQASSDLKIHSLSIYAFSTENWNRSDEEVSALMALLLEFFAKEIDELHAKNVVIRILGDIGGLPQAQREAVLRAMERTKSNTGLHLNIALNYGSRAEIVHAVKEISSSVQKGMISLDDITEDLIAQNLYTKGLPDVDLVIRTSGEMRLSNFLLYQSAYAEFLFPEVLWPDFTKEHFLSALDAYMKRDRRFGKRTDE